jgi:hypothetical protein
MARLRRVSVIGASILLLSLFSGCSVLHELQWHRLWRMNYGPSNSTDSFFSVQDPVAPRATPSAIPQPDQH